MPYYVLDGHSRCDQVVGDVLQVFAPGGHFGGGSERAVHLAGDVLLNVQKVERRAVDAGKRGGMSDGVAIPGRMVERHQDFAVIGNGQGFGDGGGHFREVFTGCGADGRGKPGFEDHPGEQDGDARDHDSQTAEQRRAPWGSKLRRPAESPVAARRMLRTRIRAAASQARILTHQTVGERGPSAARLLVK